MLAQYWDPVQQMGTVTTSFTRQREVWICFGCGGLGVSLQTLFRTIYAAVKDFKLFRETLQTDVSL